MDIVLGAGPAGLFCAHDLRNKGIPFIILEKENYIGGLAATHEFNDSHFEIGPHILYTQDEEILDIAKSYLGADLILKDWSVKQFVGGHVLVFPNTLSDMTSKLGFRTMLTFLISFLKHQKGHTNSYSEFIYSRVGKELAEFSVINYTEKMWGVSLDDLETEWIKPRLDRFTIKQIISNTIRPKSRSFYYPRLGSGQLYEKMSSEMDIHTNEYPIRLECTNGKIHKVITNKSEYEPDLVFSSLPLETLVTLLDPLPNEHILEAASNLTYRSQIYVAIQFEVDQILDCQWIYFNDEEIPFARTHEPRNFSDINVSPGKTMLVSEYFTNKKHPLWSCSEQELYELTLSHLKAKEVVNNQQILGYKILRKENAYPMMTTDRMNHLKIVNEYLSDISNLKTIGRHGLHTFDNQDTAGRSALNAVRSAYP